MSVEEKISREDINCKVTIIVVIMDVTVRGCAIFHLRFKVRPDGLGSPSRWRNRNTQKSSNSYMIG